MTKRQKKSALYIMIFSIFTASTVSCKVNDSPSLTLEYTGPSCSPQVVYAVWIEDSDGKNIQNIYICQTVAAHSLTGDALPYWYTVKQKEDADVDGVTGASTQVSKTINRTLALGSVRKFRVCFEIDRSQNGNSYFEDRPSFTYKTDLIDLDNLQDSYDVKLNGWMSNDTTTSPYNQSPISDITGWSAYTYMTDLRYIAETNTEDDWSDMVTSLTVTITGQ